MFKKLFKKKVSHGFQNEDDNDQSILDKIMLNLDEARKSKGFMVCISRIYQNDKGEDMLRHHVFRARLNDEDVDTAIKAYQEQVNIQRESDKIKNTDNVQNLDDIDPANVKTEQ